jgi:hypothetical protein
MQTDLPESIWFQSNQIYTFLYDRSYHILNFRLKEMSQGTYTGILFPDFKKAFDMVNRFINLMT